MKKVNLLIWICALFLFTGCEEVKLEEYGNYKEGTYFATAEDNFGGELNTATATIYVDKYGMLRSVTLDTTYTKDGEITTKKALKEAYGMKSTSAQIGNIVGGKEWYEQIEALEKKVVAEQGLDFIHWLDKEQTKTDSISGCTIKIDALWKALQDALNQAK